MLLCCSHPCQKHPSTKTAILAFGKTKSGRPLTSREFITQPLIRTICPNCLTPYYPPAELLDIIHYRGDRRRQFVCGEGCSECYDTGFQGRTGIYEVLTVTPELRQIIGKTPDLQLIQEYHRQHGGITLLEEGIRCAEEGRTSIDEVMRVALFD